MTTSNLKGLLVSMSLLYVLDLDWELLLQKLIYQRSVRLLKQLMP